MRTTEERLNKMHKRAREIKRERDKAILRIMGSLSAGLTVCLVLVLQQLQHINHGIIGTSSAGSSLLSDSAGGYVLIAVIAFTLGVIITAAIYMFRKSK